MFLKQVLIQAMDLGKMMLISGAGVSRVEDRSEERRVGKECRL